jgi:hypothetical protein
MTSLQVPVNSDALHLRPHLKKKDFRSGVGFALVTVIAAISCDKVFGVSMIPDPRIFGKFGRIQRIVGIKDRQRWQDFDPFRKVAQPLRSPYSKMKMRKCLSTHSAIFWEGN